MEPTGSLLCSQDPAIGPYPELDKFKQHFPVYLFEIYWNVILSSIARFSKRSRPVLDNRYVLCPSAISFMRSTYPAQFMILDLMW
jgi:hypothetical protein